MFSYCLFRGHKEKLLLETCIVKRFWYCKNKKIALYYVKVPKQEKNLMRFRQVHLDFHTSELIPGIGEKFDKKQWQDTLRAAAVDSITCFSCCHHGYSYHPTKVGMMHPHLKFNLLREQIDACHEIGVNVPIYLTAGINQYACTKNPAWRAIDRNGVYTSWNDSPLKPGYYKICFNADGYLDYLCDLIEESVTMFPDADGVFLDITSQPQCCCPACIRDMLACGLDPEKENDRKKMSRMTMLKYYRRTFEAVRKHSADMPVFHNAGHVTMGDTEILPYFSHLELESLPTGGWGYDHYPVSAAYTRKLGMEFLGMTGKFHTSWGEFGGFKHPNALRYECSLMLANGSKCSIGDQLHPSGKIDASTYDIIGQAYREVREKEQFCDNVTSPADIAIVAVEPFMSEDEKLAITTTHPEPSTGASRLLLELHQFFDFVTLDMDLSQYKVLILPDVITLNEAEEKILKSFLERGGKLVLSGDSGFDKARKNFLFDIGAEVGEKGPSNPDYLLPDKKFSPEYLTSPMVMYAASRRVKAGKDSCITGDIFDSYFNRTYTHFCSHKHTPNQPEASGFASGVLTGNILYFAHPVFDLYRRFGNTAVKEYFAKAFFALLGGDRKFECSLPSQGRATLQHQQEFNRDILHLLFATPALRGGGSEPAIEVIEELLPCPAVSVKLKTAKKVKSVTIVPENRELAFSQDADTLAFEAPAFTCHQMISIQY